MIPKLKQATIVDCSDKQFNVILLIQKKGKSLIEIEVVADGRKGENVIDFFNDYWHSIEIDGQIFDVNFWHKEKGELRATLYPTRNNGQYIETITNKFSGCKLKSIPRSEYEICKDGI